MKMENAFIAERNTMKKFRFLEGVFNGMFAFMCLILLLTIARWIFGY